MAKENTKPVDQENEDQNPKEESEKKEFWLKRGFKKVGGWVQEHKKGVLAVAGGLAGAAGAALTLAKIGMAKMNSAGDSEESVQDPESGTESESAEVTE